MFALVCVYFRELFKNDVTLTRLEGEMEMGFTSLRSFFSVLKISEVHWPNLHLCKFNGVFVTFPVEPVDPLWKSRVQIIRKWLQLREI